MTDNKEPEKCFICNGPFPCEPHTFRGEVESVKPCPFCGKNPGQQYGEDISSDCGCILFNDAGPFLRKETWNNAWAHRYIAEVEAELKKRSDMLERTWAERDPAILRDANRIAALEKRNAELESANYVLAQNALERSFKIVELERQLKEGAEGK